jgi:hypothetical protein
MFWLFENIDKISFIQLFPYYNKYKDSTINTTNWLYDFAITNNEMPEIGDIIPIEISYTISIKDNYIQYINDNKILTFKVESEFIKECDEINTYKIPLFKWKYILVDNHKIPNISIENYDFHYQCISFKIYKFTEKKLFVIEQINNTIKKYILEQN